MRTKLILVIAVIVVAMVAVVGLSFFLMQGLGTRRFPDGRFPGGNNTRFPPENITLDENKIKEVSAVFENAETYENITEYCGSHRMECGYYCRNINPGHEFCNNFRDLRNAGGVQI
jgi:flagellar basal body-associated protein FliL